LFVSMLSSVRALSLKMSAVSYKSAFMFPGQGAQTVGMAGPVCAELPAAKALFDKASAILGYDLLKVCVEGPKEKLDSTVVAQTALFVSSMAALEKLKAENSEAYNSGNLHYCRQLIPNTHTCTYSRTHCVIVCVIIFNSTTKLLWRWVYHSESIVPSVSLERFHSKMA
jgi:Acyl transferase domain